MLGKVVGLWARRWVLVALVVNKHFSLHLMFLIMFYLLIFSCSNITLVYIYCWWSGHFVNLPQVTTIDRFDCIWLSLLSQNDSSKMAPFWYQNLSISFLICLNLIVVLIKVKVNQLSISGRSLQDKWRHRVHFKSDWRVISRYLAEETDSKVWLCSKYPLVR
jgi:hypothetical protein